MNIFIIYLSNYYCI